MTAARPTSRTVLTRLLVFMPLAGSILNLLPPLALPLDLNVALELNLTLTPYYAVLHFLGLVWLLAAAACCSLRVRALAGACLLLLLATYAAAMAPYYLPAEPPPLAAGSGFSLYYANVASGNDAYGKVRAQLSLRNPDVVVLNEMTEAWIAALRLRDRYPFAVEVPRPLVGITIYSRLPLRAERRLSVDPYTRPVVTAELVLPNEAAVTVAVLHAYPPRSNVLLESRNEFLRRAASRIAALPAPVLVLGDLNISPFSPVFGQFQAAADLRNARYGRGLLYSWRNDDFPVVYASIDHFFTRGAVVVTELERLDDIGSDHLPFFLRCTTTA